ncbi:MAG: hypothetical protein RL427_1181 [Bacteroidota bacterium]
MGFSYHKIPQSSALKIVMQYKNAQASLDIIFDEDRILLSQDPSKLRFENSNAV